MYVRTALGSLKRVLRSCVGAVAPCLRSVCETDCAVDGHAPRLSCYMGTALGAVGVKYTEVSEMPRGVQAHFNYSQDGIGMVVPRAMEK